MACDTKKEQQDAASNCLVLSCLLSMGLIASAWPTLLSHTRSDGLGPRDTLHLTLQLALAVGFLYSGWVLYGERGGRTYYRVVVWFGFIVALAGFMYQAIRWIIYIVGWTSHEPSLLTLLLVTFLCGSLWKSIKPFRLFRFQHSAASNQQENSNRLASSVQNAQVQHSNMAHVDFWLCLFFGALAGVPGIAASESVTPDNWFGLAFTSSGAVAVFMTMAGVVQSWRRNIVVASIIGEFLGSVMGLAAQRRGQGDAGIAFVLAGQAIGGFAAALSAMAIVRIFKRACRPGHCKVCDYDLRGLPLPRCPECGTEFDSKSLEPDIEDK